MRVYSIFRGYTRRTRIAATSTEQEGKFSSFTCLINDYQLTVVYSESETNARPTKRKEYRKALLLWNMEDTLRKDQLYSTAGNFISQKCRLYVPQVNFLEKYFFLTAIARSNIM